LKTSKNVLLITFYWPPSGGAGVHRWLRFSAYFKQNGCNLTVFCPEDAAWPVMDEELLKQVPKELTILRRKVIEPHKYLGEKSAKGTGFSQNKKAGIIQKFIIWVRGNLFIPDARVFWIGPSTRFLSKYLTEHPEIDTIISTGPPHSTHLIAQKLKKKHALKWLADFRDPWTQIDFYHDLLPGKRADSKHKRLEKMCLTEADEVITVSNSCATGLQEIECRPVHVITNGYNFPTFDASKVKLNEAFTIVHFGSMPFARNPQVVWNALSELITEQPELDSQLRIHLIGTVDYQVIEAAEAAGLKPYLHIMPAVTHAKSLMMQREAQLLLLAANNTGNVKGILTGKFFEYLGAQRPIIAVGQKNSDLESAFNATQAGHFSDFKDTQSMKTYISESFKLYQEQKLLHAPVNIEQFSSEKLAKDFIKLI